MIELIILHLSGVEKYEVAGFIQESPLIIEAAFCVCT